MSAQRGAVKLKPCLADALCRQPGPGDVAARLRCAQRATTRTGPCDAVIDVVRSRRLTSGARLLLLPALGLPRALFRCLRRLPSLLRHAALLAVSEWRCRTVPAGIANTALGLLQRDKKTSIFAGSSVLPGGSTPHVARSRARRARANRCTTRSCRTRCKLYRLLENADGIRVFATRDVFPAAPKQRCARRACARQEPQ